MQVLSRRGRPAARVVLSLAFLAGFFGACTKKTNKTASAVEATPSKATQPAPPPSRIKVGFIVKQPEEPWFQLEWRFADQAAAKLNFDLIKIGAADGEKVLAAIDNLAANGAKGFIICTPDVKLGPAIAMRAKEQGLKVLSVDDQFLGSNGQPMADVPYLGISARKIGNQVGEELWAEMQRRGWSLKDTAAAAITFDELATARERTEGAKEALLAKGFAAERVFAAATKTLDVPGAFDAVNILLTKHQDVKNWLVYSVNDNSVLGAVRALEGNGRRKDNVIAIGINGTDSVSELSKPAPTGFYGSMLLSAKDHGFRTAEMMYYWLKDGKQPPADTRTVGTLITRETFKAILKEQGVL